MGEGVQEVEDRADGERVALERGPATHDDFGGNVVGSAGDSVHFSGLF